VIAAGTGAVTAVLNASPAPVADDVRLVAAVAVPVKNGVEDLVRLCGLAEK
jgi:hypothetical protein